MYGNDKIIKHCSTINCTSYTAATQYLISFDALRKKNIFLPPLSSTLNASNLLSLLLISKHNIIHPVTVSPLGICYGHQLR